VSRTSTASANTWSCMAEQREIAVKRCKGGVDIAEDLSFIGGPKPSLRPMSNLGAPTFPPWLDR